MLFTKMLDITFQERPCHHQIFFFLSMLFKQDRINICNNMIKMLDDTNIKKLDWYSHIGTGTVVLIGT